MLLLVLLLTDFRGEIDDFRCTGWSVSRAMVALPQGIPIVWGTKRKLGDDFRCMPDMSRPPTGALPVVSAR